MISVVRKVLERRELIQPLRRKAIIEWLVWWSLSNNKFVGRKNYIGVGLIYDG
jgi:hypothetical protein